MLLVQKFALVLGIVYLAVGILGFIPPLLTDPQEVGGRVVEGFHGYLLGLFPVNWLHHLVHIAVGVWGLSAAKRFAASVTFSRGLAILYGILTIFGLFPGLNTLFGLVPLYSHDIWLHALTALVAAYFGWGPPAKATAPVADRPAA